MIETQNSLHLLFTMASLTTPFKTILKKGLSLALLSLTLLSSGCAWWDNKQRELIYRPTPGNASQWQSVSGNDELFWLTPPNASAPGQDDAPKIRAIWMPQPDTDAPVVLYLHGTFRNVFQNRPKIVPIYQAGFSVLAIEYRGWGDSTAMTPSEVSILQDARLGWRELVRRAPNRQHRVLYGHSMGGGVAIDLAKQEVDEAGQPRYGALVVESSFSSIPDIARDYGGIGYLGVWLTNQKFESVKKIPQVPGPKWFVAGTSDKTIPFIQTQRLYDAAHQPKLLYRFEGGSHSRLQDEFPEQYRDIWAEVRRTVLQTP